MFIFPNQVFQSFVKRRLAEQGTNLRTSLKNQKAALLSMSVRRKGWQKTALGEGLTLCKNLSCGVVNLKCQLDGNLNHLGDKPQGNSVKSYLRLRQPLGILLRKYLDQFNKSGKNCTLWTAPLHRMVSYTDKMKRKLSSSTSLLSAS